MSNLPAVTDDTFDSEVLKSDKPVVVDFYADWCGPCKAVAPILEELAKEHSDKVKFVKLNVDEAKNTAASFGIMSIPTVIVFKGGRPANKVVGARDKKTYEAAIQ